MKKLLLLGISIFSFANFGSSQVFVIEDLEAGAPAGWTSTFFLTSANTCGTQAYRANIYSFNATGDITTTPYTSTGGQIDISFDYVITDYSFPNAGTTGDWGSITLEHSIDGGANWSTDTIIDQSNHVPATTCATVSTFNTGVEVPAASSVQYRFNVAFGTTGDFYVAIDNISLIEVVACPAPTAITTTDNDLTTATFSWGAGSEPEWELEYGAPGFTPGTGTGITSVVTSNPGTITGIASSQFYEVYVRAICGAGDTSGYNGPASFNTMDMPAFMATSTECPTAGFVDIRSTGTDANLGYGAGVGVTLPFSLYYQGNSYDEITVHSHGAILLGTLIGNISWNNGALSGTDPGLYAFWDDLTTGNGLAEESVWYELIGTAPNRTFIAQWNLPHWNNTVNPLGLQIQIDEATNEIYYVYDDLDAGDANLDNGAAATIGVSGNQNITVSYNDANYLTNNSCAKFYYTDCPTASGFTASGITVNQGTISWTGGLAGETEWTVIYGEQGFDPTTSGTTVGSLTTPTLTTPPTLDDITAYDFYIYSDCNPGVLQSLGYMGTFTTLPNCADPTGLTVSTLVDSLDLSWMFTESSPTYASTGFNLQYGSTGFDLHTGTVVAADNNNTDTIVDNTMLPGMNFDIYIQTECGTDTSNYVGPISFTSPLVNDSTCFAAALTVDGTIYNFNNNGVTVGLNEASIAPPVTGYNNTTGWGQASIFGSTWFTFEAPASGRVKISGRDGGYQGKTAVYSVTDCGDLSTFTFVGANQENEYGTYTPSSEYTLCGLTPGSTYYLMHDRGFSWTAEGNYTLRLEEPLFNAGTSNGLLDVCAGGTVDLSTGVTGSDAGGVWTEEIPTAGFSGSDFNSAGLAYQVYNFEYRIQEGCYYDSVVQQVQVYGPSSAGIDGSVSVCINEPFNLVTGLTGNVDLGGTWYDPQNNALTSGQIMSPTLGGQYNYAYITGNGVCADDTANVVVTVDMNCDWLSIDEQSLENLSVYPNPTQGSVFVSNLTSTEVFNITVTDLKGRVVVDMDNALNGTETTEISLENLEDGFYMIKVYNDNAQTMFRVVKK